MRSAGALIASIGTSVMLIAAVVLSLLSFSAVFALGGFEGADDPSSGDTLVLDLPEPSGSDGGSRRTVQATRVAVVRRSAQPRRRSVAARRAAPRRDTVRANRASTRTATGPASQVAALDAGTTAEPPASRQPPAPTVTRRPRPNVGDGVRQLGDELSSAVQQTGTNLAQATQPLGKPVSAAVQNVLNIVAALLKGTTDGLGAVLGARP